MRERDHGFCLLCWLECERVQGTEVHHIVPRGKCVGQWWHLRQDERNLTLLCAKHHHPSPSRDEAKAMLLYLRQRYGYEYDEVPFRQVLGEM